MTLDTIFRLFTISSKVESKFIRQLIYEKTIPSTWDVDPDFMPASPPGGLRPGGKTRAAAAPDPAAAPGISPIQGYPEL
jgi:hypothetical protein